MNPNVSYRILTEKPTTPVDTLLHRVTVELLKNTVRRQWESLSLDEIKLINPNGITPVPDSVLISEIFIKDDTVIKRDEFEAIMNVDTGRFKADNFQYVSKIVGYLSSVTIENNRTESQNLFMVKGLGYDMNCGILLASFNDDLAQYVDCIREKLRRNTDR